MSIIIIIILLIVYISLGFHGVPEKWEYLVSRFQKYNCTKKAGLYWLPFGFFKLDHKVFMGEQALPLSLGRDGFGGGVVDFKDGSAPVEAFFNFRIFDSFRAAYLTADILKMIEEKADGVLRSFLAQYDIEEANELKNGFNLGIIASMTKYIPGAQVPVVTSSDFYKILHNWGIEPLSFTVTDIELPQVIIEQRQRVLQATKDVEVAELGAKKAEHEAKTTLIKASGDAKGMDEITAAMAGRIKALVEKGMSPQEAAAYVVNITKAEALKNSQQVTWIESNKSAARGASFGAGINSVNKKK